MCTVLLDKGLFLKNRTALPKKRSVWPSSGLKTVDLDYRSSLSVARLVRFWFKSLQTLTAHDRQFLQGNLFLLAMCTHKVAFVAIVWSKWALLVITFWARNTPQTVSRNLNTHLACVCTFLNLLWLYCYVSVNIGSGYMFSCSVGWIFLNTAIEQLQTLLKYTQVVTQL